MSRQPVAVAVVMVVLVAGAGLFYWRSPNPPVVVVDHLCEFVRKEQKMDCVAVLASDSFMKPGAIVDYSP
ncbi:hypothetical protein [Methylobacterium sp. PvR107]|uniref:hypothetical protein n=1 Tax=Methylobacterium sp. PvR107 TaxID=2806597 RepID=UPI001AE4F5C1|nr:hypothetical protein [Methylobacterium sp. PvR107]MBP1184200.1 hypothetical protein [Methylobacterium sp. PvR107]